jgi:uncharacterized protein YegL
MQQGHTDQPPTPFTRWTVAPPRVDTDPPFTVDVTIGPGQRGLHTVTADFAWREPASASGATLASPESPSRIEIVLCIDTSGSMENEDRIGRVIKTVQSIADSLTPSTCVHLITFSGSVKVECTGVTSETAGKLREAASRLRAHGETDILEALVQCVKTLSTFRTAERTDRHIFLLSDGQPTRGETNAHRICERFASLCAREDLDGVRVHAFGIGDQYDPTILNKLSEQSGGHAHKIAASGAIPEAVGRAFAAIRSQGGRGAVDIKIAIAPCQPSLVLDQLCYYGKPMADKCDLLSSTPVLAAVGNILSPADARKVMFMLDSYGLPELAATQSRMRPLLEYEVWFRVPGVSSDEDGRLLRTTRSIALEGIDAPLVGRNAEAAKVGSADGQEMEAWYAAQVRECVLKLKGRRTYVDGIRQLGEAVEGLKTASKAAGCDREGGRISALVRRGERFIREDGAMELEERSRGEGNVTCVGWRYSYLREDVLMEKDQPSRGV